MRAALLVLALAPFLTAQTQTELHKRVREYVEPVAAQGLFSGAILLAKGGEVVFEGAWGVASTADKKPITVTTRFKLMSITKTLTCALVMRLVQEGKVALTDKVGKHVPDWPAGWSAVTLHDLLDHTSGIPSLEAEWSAAEDAAGARGKPAWPAFAATLKGKELMSHPGTESKYSNFNLELAGVAVEYVSGQGFRNFLGAKLLGPLGMEATGFDDGSRFPELAIGCDIGRDGAPVETRQDMSRIQAACGLYSTVGDLFKFDRALRGRDLIDPALHKVMVTPRVGGMACSWVNQPMNGRPCYRHSGRSSGYSGDFLRFPDDDATVIVLSNHAYDASQRTAQDLAAILLGSKKVVQPQAVDAAMLRRCAGAYDVTGGAQIVMHRFGDKLAVFRGEGQFFGAVVLPIGNGVFAEPGPGDVRLDFEAPPSKKSRRTVDAAATNLQRSDAAAKWKGLVGAFDPTPMVAKTVNLVAAGDFFALQLEGWPPIDVVPITENKALAIYDGLACTTIYRDGNSLRLRVNSTDFKLDRRKQ